MPTTDAACSERLDSSTALFPTWLITAQAIMAAKYGHMASWREPTDRWRKTTISPAKMPTVIQS